MKTVAIFFVKAYQLCISPLIGQTCRFTPSCSEYAIQALNKHGFFRGFWMTLKRISKCNPWHPGGVDEP